MQFYKKIGELLRERDGGRIALRVQRIGVSWVVPNDISFAAKY